MLFRSYLGGTLDDEAHGIAVDGTGNAYISGFTNSTNFPTAAPIQAKSGGGWDTFATKINVAGNTLVYSTYLGGTLDDEARSIAVDGAGNAYISGHTNSTNFPTAMPVQATLGGGWDAFITKLNAAGSTLVYSTYLGGTLDDKARSIAVDGTSNAYIAGFTASTNFPTATPIQATLGDSNDGFVAKISANTGISGNTAPTAATPLKPATSQ